MTTRVNPRIRLLSDLFDLDAREMKVMTTEVDKQFRKNMKRLFATEGASGGKRWKRLTPKYAKRKRKKRRGRKILVYNRDMRDSITNAGHRDHVAEFSLNPPYVEVGTNSDIARYHAEGGGRLPVRNPIQQTDSQKRRYHQIVVKQLRIKMRRLLDALKQW